MVSKEIQVYHKNLGDWVKLSEMESPAYCHCLVVLNDYLFVVGGQEIFGNQFLKASDKKYKIDNNGNTATNSVFRFNPRFDKWDRMESMRDTRTDFHVSVLNGCLYAIGGRNNRGPLSSAEKYRVDKFVPFFWI